MHRGGLNTYFKSLTLEKLSTRLFFKTAESKIVVVSRCRSRSTFGKPAGRFIFASYPAGAAGKKENRERVSLSIVIASVRLLLGRRNALHSPPILEETFPGTKSISTARSSASSSILSINFSPPAAVAV